MAPHNTTLCQIMTVSEFIFNCHVLEGNNILLLVVFTHKLSVWCNISDRPPLTVPICSASHKIPRFKHLTLGCDSLTNICLHQQANSTVSGSQQLLLSDCMTLWFSQAIITLELDQPWIQTIIALVFLPLCPTHTVEMTLESWILSFSFLYSMLPVSGHIKIRARPHASFYVINRNLNSRCVHNMHFPTEPSLQIQCDFYTTIKSLKRQYMGFATTSQYVHRTPMKPQPLQPGEEWSLWALNF